MYIAILLAFIMTLITASSNIVLKKGFLKISPFLAMYISVGVSVIFLWIASILFVPNCCYSNYQGIGVFVLIGIFAPAIVRTLTYYGIHTLGAGLSAPLRAMTPFFAVIIAIIFLKEAPRPGIFLGIFLIVLGVALLAKKEKKHHLQQINPVHFFYPLAAALLAGAVANLRKYGLGIMPQPVFASAIAATSSLIVLTIYVLVKYKDKIERIKRLLLHKRELKFVIIAALLVSAGEIVDLSALLFGKVSLVVPIFGVTPLTIILFSRIFLKDHEVVTKKLAVSAVIIICGIYLVVANAR